jgi:SAM-dependent methyltransferase
MTSSTSATGHPLPGNSGRQGDPNLPVYNKPEVAAHYASLNYLSPCEQVLFDEFLKQGDAILDLGVGGGRTTPHLSRLASRYVGVDYAPKMVAACQQKFPQLEFLVSDATNLALLADGTFDRVVMAFNGMDALVPDEARRRCLAEIHRVLRNGGVLIFSSHNPRAVFLRPGWNPRKIDEIARMLVGQSQWLLEPVRILLLCLRIALALAKSAMESAHRLLRRVWHRAFWSGDGYMVDPAHGGLLSHYAVPARVIAEVEQEGFQILRFEGDDYPRRSRAYVTDWYYYVFRKAETSVSAPCA